VPEVEFARSATSTSPPAWSGRGRSTSCTSKAPIGTRGPSRPTRQRRDVPERLASLAL